MDLTRSEEDIRFRAEVREFLAQELPADLRAHNDGALHSKPEETLSWQKILHRKGWGAPHWPERFGGTGWTPYQRMIFDIECARAGAPWTNQQGMGLLGPVVNAFGSDEQRVRFIPPLIAGETFWAQGFSEPGSGSDLASLSTAARREGDEYVVDGQKIWTSHARYAHWIFLLVRTNKEVRKHEGISFLVLPIDSSGIT
ncbi:MAG TPA: acyl-CoA dehydrogenase family protein, partial [Sphingomicrobium sp.]